MCSIAGLVGKKGVSKMLKIQKHRAPDEEGVFKDDHIELGMGRLKIIDLVSKGLCPYEEDDFVLSYNGEIYNYIELKKELQKLGWRFKTTCDTEVLMKAWRQWQFKMFDKLNGMFALALYDKRRKKIILARDIAGEKPLYFYSKGKIFAFASEAKAFKNVVPLNYRQDDFFDTFEHCRLKTLWQDLSEVPPASYLVYDLPQNRFFIKEYWDFKPRRINVKTAEEELSMLLEDAIKIRTRSDVPYGLYYSGGVDSSLIESFFKFNHKFYFDDGKNWKNDFFKNVKNISWHLDFPVGSLSSYPLWKLAETASKKVKVVISGEGADEVFGGYVRYLPIAAEYELRKKLPSYNYLFNKYYPGYLEGFSKITARNGNEEYVKSALKPFFDKFEDPINAMGYADFKLIMPSLLQMGDRMAGAFGIENRCPFLDKRIIEFGFSLPPELKIDGASQKVILRKILEKRGIVAPLKREKMGLTIPFNKWSGKSGWDRKAYFDLVKSNWTAKNIKLL
ncbi:MAG: asparagine synthase-related protein [Candidatus Azambacteria bacterium]|nr:asparagine synthase-related protein [Candidatus Azambacteria bacterium]